ncbi:GDSL esterase/lipase At1g09390-like [Cynara cardunculus var. scolymus]|uniref:GDSL esterase/lipase At1g09390-like n=1 Tax=Cynara cardunculus var. scolymus TaxID=59895 RepID=UPI000D626808|nr:GDSL esterase/lipase At1g09390-like [Cynara cardunculus var. scolymus]
MASSNFISLYFSIFIIISSLLHSTESLCSTRPLIFNFGDSNSDTGGLVAGLGYSVTSPYGRTFFRRSTGRLSDGRLVIDFLCQSVQAGLLPPYMESLGSTFSNGANFAVVGSSTLPKFIPFALNVQVMQFLHFKSRSNELLAAGSGKMINGDGFQQALYMIDIGQNDLSDAFAKKYSYAKVIKRIPFILAEIKNAIKSIHDNGGRKFWVHNTGPLGCLPQKLWLVQPSSRELDPHGCISTYNSAANLFNEGLRHLCAELRSELKDATVVYVDIYSIKYDLVANANKYGFSSPLMTCCGFGGPPYNYNINVTCGHGGARACNEGSKFVSWDGIHLTEAANSILASKILSQQYSTPRLPFDFFCH